MIDRNTNVQITDEALAFAKPMLAEVAVFNEDALLTMSERMQSNELDLILTSPPYYNARDYSQYKSVQDYLGGEVSIKSNSLLCILSDIVRRASSLKTATSANIGFAKARASSVI
jgi:tRNA1(Val) A37 N6-methylase TrmN6